YSLSAEYGIPVADIFAMKGPGMGWGQIKKQLQLQDTALDPANSAKPGKPAKPDKPDKPGKNKNKP
ncbi:MAG: hypothetical protein P8Y03_10115, partial [Anaerolineales bacterium]